MRLSAVFAASALWFAAGVPPLDAGGVANMTPASTIPFCGGENFVGGWVGQNGATGTSIEDLAFINDGHVTCRLAGYPTIQGYQNGLEYPLTAGHLKDQVFDISPTTLGPRMSAEMVLTTSASCNAMNSGNQTAIKKVIAKDTYTVSVKFPHSNDPISIYGLNVNVACGLNITGLGWR
jgi:hypothetical protein